PRVELYDRLIEDDEAIDLFRNCALLVLPYHDATQSALVGAAYAFGKPVIVTRTGALPEYVDEGETGWVVPPGDAQALADCLSQALSDPERLIRMGQNGQAWYNRHRNAEWEALQRLYLKLAGATYGEESSAPDEVRGQQEAV
ncbi:MAG: glycosyltransferase, partial [Anaerolineae bacterium]|nr:glycosyltransferase [Anaerolineae bacterium]